MRIAGDIAVSVNWGSGSPRIKYGVPRTVQLLPYVKVLQDNGDIRLPKK